MERVARGNHQISLRQQETGQKEDGGGDKTPGGVTRGQQEPVDKDPVLSDGEEEMEEPQQHEEEEDGSKKSSADEQSPPPVEEVCAPKRGSGNVTDMSSMQEGSAGASWNKQRQELGLNMTTDEEKMRQKMAGKVSVFAKVKLFNEMNEHKFAYKGPVMKLACGYLRYNEGDVSRQDWGQIVPMLKKGMSEARNRLRNAIRMVVKGTVFCVCFGFERMG